uniref:PAS_4 domain-containing protein n=1 Tax=Syphacia muris TaxID=451379 RepID=A0A0N5AEL0_9BILA
MLSVEDHVDQMPHPSSRPFPNNIPWHPGFCVARTDERSLICYHNEQAANRVGRHLPRTRLDGGFRSFWKHWRTNDSLLHPAANDQRRKEQYFGTLADMPSYRTMRGLTYVLKEESVEDLITDSLPLVSGGMRSSTVRPLTRKHRSKLLER